MTDIKQNTLSLPVSHYRYCWASTPLDSLVSDALELIKSDSLQEITSKLRNLVSENPDEYHSSKKKLPCVTFCASFHGERRKENINFYNSLMILDIDKVSKDELYRIKKALMAEETIFAFWESPSGNGIKGLIPIHYEFDITCFGFDAVHKMAFLQITEYLKTKYDITLDEQGSDYTRLCFLSCDKNLVIKDDCIPFSVKRREISPYQINRNTITQKVRGRITRDILYNPLGKNNLNDKVLINKIIKFLKGKKLSITHNYDDWMRVGFALSNTFTFDLASKFFHELSRMDQTKYNENDCTGMLINCYEHSYGKISFRTIIYMAEMKGFKIKKSDTGSTSPVPVKQESRNVAT